MESSNSSMAMVSNLQLLKSKTINYSFFNAKSFGLNYKTFFLLITPLLKNSLEFQTLLDVFNSSHYFKIHIDSDCRDICSTLFFFINIYPKNSL
jgi:hypothetical protein